MALGSIIFPVKVPNQNMPNSLISGGANGVPINIGYGVFRCAANIIWYPGLTQHKSKQSSGGKGGPSYSSTSYTYFASIAAAFGESFGNTASTRSGNVIRVWFDSKIVYDLNNLNPSKYVQPTIYPGSETQMPDPTIQAAVGAAQCSAYRGLIYAVWENFPLADFGNRLPNIQGLVSFGQVGFSQTNVTVDGRCRPWNINVNPSLSYDIVNPFDGLSPTSVTVIPGEEVAINYISGTVSQGSGFTPYDANGIPSSNGRGGNLPGQWVAGYGPCRVDGLLVSFADATGKIVAGGGPYFNTYTNSYIVPIGATQMLLGVNDGHVFSDNGGSWLVSVTSGTTTLASVVTDICIRAGLSTSQIDVSQLSGLSVSGYLINQQTDCKTALQTLLAAYFVDCVESDFKLKFIPRGTNSAVMTIPESDLGVIKDKGKLTEQHPQVQDLPREVNVTHIDPSISWQQNKAHKHRHLRASIRKQIVTMNLQNMVLSPDQATQLAERALYLAYLEGINYNINLWKAAYLPLDCTDVVDFVYEGNTYQIRLEKQTTGVDLTSTIAGVSENSNVYLSQAIGGISQGPPSEASAPPAPAVWFIYDIPYLQDADAVADRSQTGYYWGASSAVIPWPGAVLYSSSNNSAWETIGLSNGQCTYGTANNALGTTPSLWAWDNTNTLTVTLTEGTLSSSTNLDVLNGANPLLVGNELIQYVNATLISPGVYTLSRLLRGRRNTEYACTGHAIGDVVVDPTTGFLHEEKPLSILNLLRYYRGVTIGDDISTVTSQNLTLVGNDLKPAMPVHITGSRDISGNLTIDWFRRTRYAGDWLENTGSIPLNEDSEQYQIDVLNGLTVVRTINWVPGTYDANGNPQAAYSAAQQTTDFGSPQASISIKIYQMSGQVGRGFPGSATV